jgi:hypothetical protein
MRRSRLSRERQERLIEHFVAGATVEDIVAALPKG